MSIEQRACLSRTQRVVIQELGSPEHVDADTEGIQIEQRLNNWGANVQDSMNEAVKGLHMVAKKMANQEKNSV